MNLRSVVVAWAVVLSLCAGSQAEEKNHVRAEVIPSVSAVAPGGAFEIAVRFVIDDGWHTYWTNPGDSGLPPRVQWKAPAGVSVGSLRFPTPHRIDAGEGLVSYGYEREMVMLATVTTTREVAGPIEIAAEIRWLVCKGVCLTEKQSATLTVPVGESGKPDERFDGWRKLMPVPGKVQVVNESKDQKVGTLIITLADDMRDPEFYSDDADATFSGPTVLRKDTPVMRVEYRRFDTKKTSSPAVLAYTDATTGQRRAIEFTYKY